MVIILSLVGYINRIFISTKYNNRKKYKYNWLVGDIWRNDKINYIKFIISGLFTRFFSLLLGIGRSMILNPIMIDLKIPPYVVVMTLSLLSPFPYVVEFALNKYKSEPDNDIINLLKKY